nr:phage portal protein [uncultured Arsenicibacter sp.]
MIQFKRFDHILITIPPGTTELARLFYGEILSLQAISGGHPHNAIWFQMGDIQLHIREETEGPLSSRHPAFEVVSLTDAKQFLTARGIGLTYSSDIEGRDRVFFRDPFGNRFELIEYKFKE